MNLSLNSDLLNAPSPALFPPAASAPPNLSSENEMIAENIAFERDQDDSLPGSVEDEGTEVKLPPPRLPPMKNTVHPVMGEEGVAATDLGEPGGWRHPIDVNIGNSEVI